jgi:hypothetical protein
MIIHQGGLKFVSHTTLGYFGIGRMRDCVGDVGSTSSGWPFYSAPACMTHFVLMILFSVKYILNQCRLESCV